MERPYLNLLMQEHPLFDQLSNEEKKMFLEESIFGSFRKGRILTQSALSPRVYVVLKGQFVSFSTDANGNESIEDIKGQGDIWGDLKREATGHRSRYGQVTMDNSLLLSLDQAAFFRFLDRIPRLAYNYSQICQARLQRAYQRNAYFLIKQAADRVMLFMRDWATRHGRQNGNQIHLANTLTHEGIGAYLYLSRQTVTTSLRYLKELGKIEYDRNQFIIDMPGTGGAYLQKSA